MIRRTLRTLNVGTKYLCDVLRAPTPRLFYASGCPNSRNLGDVSLFEAYKRLFSEHNIVHYPGGRVLLIASKLMRLSGAAVLGGGTLINRWGLSAFQECAEIFSKICVFGTGVANPAFWSERPERRDTLDRWKPVLERCVYIGVRGPLSGESLADIGIKNVEVVGDPVLVYARKDGPTRSYLPNSLGLNLGTSLGNVWGSEESLWREYVKLAKTAKQSGWDVSWFIVWPKDLGLTKEAANLSGTADHMYEVYRDTDEYLHLVEPLSAFVGMKLHAVALATCAYVPSMMLEYRPKCRDYMASIGQEHHTIRTDEFRAEEMWDIISEWSLKRELLSAELFRSIRRLREKQRAEAKRLTEVLAAHTPKKNAGREKKN
jgi:polysaccharide pyruvyl transferase WcaK-like protein